MLQVNRWVRAVQRQTAVGHNLAAAVLATLVQVSPV
jgi:hypothetical protein